MYSAIWTYPWDFLDEGADTVLGRIADAGLQGVSVAAAYHTVRALCAHNPRRAVYHGEGGVLYFQPDARFFTDSRIRPVISDLAAGIDPLAEVCRAASRRGIRVHAWTVLHHNTRLGTSYPDCSLENAFGDRYPFGLCPANPDVRAYSHAVVSALAAVEQLDIIELESLGYMGIDHSGHHAKAGIELDALHKFLLSVCFCPHCAVRMDSFGADVERARPAIVREMRELFDGRSHAGRGDARAELDQVVGAEDADAILSARDQVVLSLLAELRDLVAAPKQLSVMVAGSPLVTGAPAGITLEKARSLTDMLVYQAFARDTAAIRSDVAGIAAHRGETPLYAGLQAIAPYVASADDLKDRVAAVRDAGAEGVQFYHYGLMPLGNLDWVRAAVS